jgi:hypothetical protein
MNTWPMQNLNTAGRRMICSMTPSSLTAALNAPPAFGVSDLAVTRDLSLAMQLIVGDRVLDMSTIADATRAQGITEMDDEHAWMVEVFEVLLLEKLACLSDAVNRGQERLVQVVLVSDDRLDVSPIGSVHPQWAEHMEHAPISPAAVEDYVAAANEIRDGSMVTARLDSPRWTIAGMRVMLFDSETVLRMTQRYPARDPHRKILKKIEALSDHSNSMTRAQMARATQQWCELCGTGPCRGRCPTCLAPYCDAACQSAHWPAHRIVCRTVRQTRPAP